MINKKDGVSMMALVVTIICVVILATIVITVGFNYMNESERVEKETILKTVKSAIMKLQNDKNVDPDIAYEGYKVAENGIIASGTIEELSKDNSQNVEIFAEDIKGKNINFLVGEWYILDMSRLRNIGVEGEALNKYVVENFQESCEENNNLKYKVILADYVSGEAIFVRANDLVVEQTDINDTTPPAIVMTCEGSTIPKEEHVVVVTISDNVGISKQTNFQYAWSTLNNIEPQNAEYVSIRTNNLVKKRSTSVEITSPTAESLGQSTLSGRYYLWIKGVQDSNGNVATTICSTFYANVNSTRIEGTITVTSNNDTSNRYAKMGDTITVMFTRSAGTLQSNPQISIKTNSLSNAWTPYTEMTANGNNYTATIGANNIDYEGKLMFKIKLRK